MQVEARKELQSLKEMTGAVLDMDPEQIPETMEEAEIFMDTNVKTDAEVAAQIATNMTLSWANFNDTTFRRAVMDLVSLGMSVVKRTNDPNKGIDVQYIDPVNFVQLHRRSKLRRPGVCGSHQAYPHPGAQAPGGGSAHGGGLQVIANKVKDKYSNDATRFNSSHYDDRYSRTIYGYDEYMVEVLDFEFISIDCMYFEEKDSRHGNTGFYTRA